MATVLAADIGGTSSRFGQFTVGADGTLAMERTVRFPTAESGSFAALVERLAEEGIDTGAADAAVFAVPGAVRRGVYVSMPNVSWDIDLDALDGPFFKRTLMLINDFKAQALATRTPAVADAMPVKDGLAVEGGVVAVIGAGTGLGHAAVALDAPGRVAAIPAEMGHVAFSFYGEAEEAFHAFLRTRLGVPYAYGDVVVSGPGLSLIHEYLVGESLEPAGVAEQGNPQVLEWFSRFYGRAARHYALAVVAQGGVFVAGGVAAKNPALVDNDVFRNEFIISPTYGDLLATIPIWLNCNEESGLWGAAYMAAQRLDLVS
ncbi:glucokinase [Oceanidesulfovibrio indonesiensis]|uniref:Glucokinase n=1 Tax=Oceanidesulfovibrio indonesiensis TaxID=54767 RepID=A0A7M3MH53_9BACT|nr:glucokinase [Oceanidesulfovibrio indonesiensis]TVM18742.1 glucokinase [Oceanidesulfovibrio indonesiensis]